jgi:hypothetical protein
MYNSRKLIRNLLLFVTTLLIAAQAEAAKVCTLRSSSGTCLFWSGSLDCENLSASGLGDAANEGATLTCEALPPDDTSDSVPVLVYCLNRGTNLPSGRNAISGVFTGSKQVTAIDKNGSVKNERIHATLQQSELDQICQDDVNKNWTGLDAVPTRTKIKVSVFEGTVDEVSQFFDCSLPNPDTLQYFPNPTTGNYVDDSGKPSGYLERRQFECKTQ